MNDIRKNVWKKYKISRDTYDTNIYLILHWKDEGWLHLSF